MSKEREEEEEECANEFSGCCHKVLEVGGLISSITRVTQIPEKGLIKAVGFFVGRSHE